MSKNARNLKEIADACIITAHSENVVTRVIDDLQIFCETLDIKPELIRFLQDSLIPIEQRLAIIDKSIGNNFHQFSKNTIAVLINKKNLKEMNAFLSHLETSARENASHYECTITTAIKIDTETQELIQTALKKKFNGTIRIKHMIDPAIIGGMIVQCGDWLYQSTTQSKLMQLHNHLVFSE